MATGTVGITVVGAGADLQPCAVANVAKAVTIKLLLFLTIVVLLI